MHPEAPRPVFRLLESGPCDPAYNLAVDEVLFRSCLEGRGPFLRFYEWRPPGLSLGRYQRDLGKISLPACRERGIPVVRRPTGGRGVLHHLELTYSIGCGFVRPFGDPRVVRVYGAVAAGLAAGLARLGATVSLHGTGPGPRARSGNCYASASRCELTWGGRKLCGSAQMRGGTGFLQHGSLLLDIDHDLWRAVFGEEAASSAVSLREILGRPVGPGEVVSALRDGMAEVLGIVFSPGSLTDKERAAAAVLARSTGRSGPKRPAAPP